MVMLLHTHMDNMEAGLKASVREISLNDGYCTHDTII